MIVITKKYIISYLHEKKITAKYISLELHWKFNRLSEWSKQTTLKHTFYFTISKRHTSYKSVSLFAQPLNVPPFFSFSFINWWQKYVRARVSHRWCTARWLCCLSVFTLSVATWSVLWQQWRDVTEYLQMSMQTLERALVLFGHSLCFCLLPQSTLSQSIKQLQRTSNDLPVSKHTDKNNVVNT